VVAELDGLHFKVWTPTIEIGFLQFFVLKTLDNAISLSYWHLEEERNEFAGCPQLHVCVVVVGSYQFFRVIFLHGKILGQCE